MHTYIQNMYVHTSIFVHTVLAYSLHISMHIYLHIVYIYIYILTYINNLYTYMHTYVHTYTIRVTGHCKSVPGYHAKVLSECRWGGAFLSQAQRCIWRFSDFVYLDSVYKCGWPAIFFAIWSFSLTYFMFAMGASGAKISICFYPGVWPSDF